MQIMLDVYDQGNVVQVKRLCSVIIVWHIGAEVRRCWLSHGGLLEPSIARRRPRPRAAPLPPTLVPERDLTSARALELAASEFDQPQ